MPLFRKKASWWDQQSKLGSLRRRVRTERQALEYATALRQLSSSWDTAGKHSTDPEFVAHCVAWRAALADRYADGVITEYLLRRAGVSRQSRQHGTFTKVWSIHPEDLFATRLGDEAIGVAAILESRSLAHAHGYVVRETIAGLALNPISRVQQVVTADIVRGATAEDLEMALAIWDPLTEDFSCLASSIVAATAT
jgi:hypothetical protein